MDFFPIRPNYGIEEDLERERRRNHNIFRASLRQLFDPLQELSDTEFKKRYRLTKEGFQVLCQDLLLLTELQPTGKVSLKTKVYCALFFFACGSYQRPVGVAGFLSQASCSRYIDEVAKALTHKNMLDKYIPFPSTPSERRRIAQKFFTKYGVPGVIGCVDGSHFKIVKPHHRIEHVYFCRKHYHSINVQMVCDSEYRILSINPKFGGATHDSFVWNNSAINHYMGDLFRQGERVWLLGDSGYPQRAWLMTPIRNPVPGSPEATYNAKHISARVTIENTFGRLKNRWRCLCKDRVLHYKPEKSVIIILACSVLYNMSISLNIQYDDEHEDFSPEIHPPENYEENNSDDLVIGRMMRSQLVERLTQ